MNIDDLVLPPPVIPDRLTTLRAEVRAFLDEERARDLWQPGVDTWLSGWDERFTKELARRGFKFVGSTICYAFMQAVGMVDDHVEGCWKYKAR